MHRCGRWRDDDGTSAVIFNSVRRLSFKKRGFRFECAKDYIGLWTELHGLVVSLEPAEAKRLLGWLKIALQDEMPMNGQLVDSLRKGVKDRDRKIETQRQEIEQLHAKLATSCSECYGTGKVCKVCGCSAAASHATDECHIWVICTSCAEFRHDKRTHETGEQRG